MDKTKKTLVLLALTVAGFLAFRFVKKRGILGSYPFADKINVKKGETFEIDFGKYSPSSGVWWVLSNESELSILKDEGQQFGSEKNPLVVGGSVSMHWRFSALKKGTEVLKFKRQSAGGDYVYGTRDVIITVE